MASSSNQDVVNNSQSVDDLSSTDGHVSQPITASAATGAQYSPAKLTDSDLAALQQDSATLGSANEPPTSHTNGLPPADGSAQSLTGAPVLNGTGSKLEDDSARSGQDGVNGGVFESSKDAGPDGEERAVQDAHGEPGVGSDEDTSRADSTEQTRDLQDKLAKASAAKKLTSFKSVSVTKAFLAKTATPVSVAKTGERGLASASPAQLVAKPRLVAKSGSGLRDVPRPRSGAETTGDGSTVWNKNRAAPPAPPKQFTDEELKQQYGIHLASRLQTDETREGSKWADIDEDEDDWAPETVTWMDGTKSTIVPDATPEPPKVVPKPEEPRTVQVKPMLALKKPSQAPTGPPRTILRPGAAQQAKSEDSVARGSPQPKASTGASAIVPTPVKSPWAPLPPVDKSIPVFSPPPPPQQAPARFGQRDAHGFDAIPPPPTVPEAALEIEADTFDRSWKDYKETEKAPRELFNSQSGRYEPAPENRRASMRHEQHPRQPALLQRPSQQDTSSPAEPSAAFQSRSSYVDGSPWAQRRRSSVSGGGSIPAFDRRQSVSKAHEEHTQPPETRTGIVIGHDLANHAPKVEVRQAPSAQQQAEARAEEVARQKKLMQEKRESAIRRRKEEEEREEAERKERIRKKMETLGMAPLDAKSRSASGTQQSTSPLQQQTQIAVRAVEGTSTAVTPSAQVPAEASAAQAPRLESQPQTAVTSLSPGKPKVSETYAGAQHSQPLQNARSDPGVEREAPMQPAPSLVQSTEEQPQKQASPRGPVSSRVPPSSYSSPGEQKQQPAFKSPSLGADSFATWGTSGMTTHTAPGGNVWGPPTAIRGIGNGAFDTGYARFAPRAHQQHNRDLPPSASFSQPSLARAPSQTLRHHDTSPMMHQQLLSDQNLASLGLADGPINERLAAASSTSVSPIAGQAKPQQLSPIAPPQRAGARGPSNPASQSAVNAWGDFLKHEAADRARIEAHASTRNANEGPARPNEKWNTTFKQTRVTGDWFGGGRDALKVESATENRSTGRTASTVPPATLPAVTSPAPPVSQSQQAMPPQAIRSGHENTVRLPRGPSSFARAPAAHTPPRTAPHAVGPQQSRFFPSYVYGGSPPPEESDHPAFSGDTKKPLVNLPAPKPQVRLPPSSLLVQDSQHQASPVIMPPRMPSYRAGAQPLVQTSDWQQRFNGLFGRVQTTTATPPSPPKTPPKMLALAANVVSSSRYDLFDQPEGTPTTVSLPRSPVLAAEEDKVTKPTVDEIFDGELSFGSTPKVFVPQKVVYAEPYTGGRNLLKLRPHPKYDQPVESQTKQSAPMSFDDFKRLSTITVSIPLSKIAAKDVPYSSKNASASQSRKASGKFAKTKRAETDIKVGSASPAPSPGMKHGSRQASFQEAPTPGPSSNAPSSPAPKPSAIGGQATPSPRSNPPHKRFPKARKASGKAQAAA